jgi:archaellum biogenesis ATPase FlaH
MLKDQSFKSIQSIQSDILEVFSDLLSETSYTDNVISMDEILDNIPADYESNEIKKFVPLFNNNLNFATNGGLRSGKVHLVSGEVSLGKSIFARQQSEWASYNKIPTMVYVTETDAREVGENTFASRSQIDNFYFKKGIVPSNENIHDIRVKIKKDSDKDYLFYKEIHDLSFRQLLDDIRLNVRKRGIGFVVIDQLTSIPTEGNTDRKTFITNCINSLVRLAQKESICILVVAQLKQSSQGKSNKKGLFENADMNDLGESADLQRLAYTVMILTAQKENQDRIRVWFPKNRGAKKDVYADIFAEKHFSRFVEDDKNAKSNL